MRITPFGDGALAESLFVNRLHEILSAWPGYEAHLASEGSVGHTASAQIRHIRDMGFAERKNEYITLRQRDQQRWYGGQCKSNRSNAGRWFWITTMLPLVALVLAIAQARYGPAPINVISPLMTLAATFLAWSQSKRLRGAGAGVFLAAVELEHLGALAVTASTEESLRDVVVDTEEAISREHKMWCVRRSVKTPG